MHIAVLCHQPISQQSHRGCVKADIKQNLTGHKLLNNSVYCFLCVYIIFSWCTPNTCKILATKQTKYLLLFHICSRKGLCTPTPLCLSRHHDRQIGSSQPQRGLSVMIRFALRHGRPQEIPAVNQLYTSLCLIRVLGVNLCFRPQFHVHHQSLSLVQFLIEGWMQYNWVIDVLEFQNSKKNKNERTN